MSEADTWKEIKKPKNVKKLVEKFEE